MATNKHGGTKFTRRIFNKTNHRGRANTIRHENQSKLKQNYNTHQKLQERKIIHKSRQDPINNNK